jgi:hypothetical protein
VKIATFNIRKQKRYPKRYRLVCCYCIGPRPTLDIDGDAAHVKCHDEACE